MQRIIANLSALVTKGIQNSSQDDVEAALEALQKLQSYALSSKVLWGYRQGLEDAAEVIREIREARQGNSDFLDYRAGMIVALLEAEEVLQSKTASLRDVADRLPEEAEVMKPCPFCDAPAERLTVLQGPSKGYCCNCHAEGPDPASWEHAEDNVQAILVWNRRPKT